MIPVAEALGHVLALARPVGAEDVTLRASAGRVLVRDVAARRDQPPFAASAMDGYAVRRADIAAGAVLRVVGTSAAGHGHDGQVGPGEALRIFTGAPVPAGADTVILQEDVIREGDVITLGQRIGAESNIRPVAADFARGDILSAPRRLSAADVALLASMNHATVPVARRPVVALIATGDELVMPGEDPGPDQIIASNSFGLAAMAEAAGAEVRFLPIARDTLPSLATALELASGADMIVTIGGASVGDHDLVARAGESLGLERSFYKVAMRPGKPLMAGRLGAAMMLGLPGNPVSAMVCATLFMVPAIEAMLGLPSGAPLRHQARLAADLPANGPREDYMRARIEGTHLRAFDRQDSSLLSVLAEANALLVRPPHAGPARAGDLVEYISL